MKKWVVLLLTGMCVALTGCRNSVPDGTKTVITVGDEKASLSALQTMVRYQQAVSYDYYKQMSQMFGQSVDKKLSFWEPEMDEESKKQELERQKTSGFIMPKMDVKTYGDQMVMNTAVTLAGYMTAAEQADSYGVSLTDDEKSQIENLAKEFLDKSDKSLLENTAITKQAVKEYLSYYTLQDKVYDKYVADSDMTVSEAESECMTISYMCFRLDESNPDADTEEKVKKQAEDYMKSLQGIDFTMLDFKQAAAELSSNASGGTESMALHDKEEAYIFDKSDMDAIKGLSAGALYGDVLKGKDQNYYVVRMDNPQDAEASAKYREELKKSRIDEAFAKQLAKWMKEADVFYDVEVLEDIDVNDTVIYTGTKQDASMDIQQDIMAGQDVAAEQEKENQQKSDEISSEKSEDSQNK